MSRTVKVLLVVQAVLIGIIFGLGAAMLASGAGVALLTATGIGGGTLLTTVPVVLGLQKAITG